MLRIVDLFCGIGGVPEAVRQLEELQVVAAIDIDRASNLVYHLNHGIQPECRTLESIRELPSADLLWLSPPCQPYTRRGLRNAERDPRSEALSHLIRCIEHHPPAALILENVPEFENSQHHRELECVLKRHGHVTSCEVLCPTQWGVPMRRRRFYLRAVKGPDTIASVVPPSINSALSEHLDESAWDDPSLKVPLITQQRFSAAMDVVTPDDPRATVACFTSAYGGSPVRAGSYLKCDTRLQLRRFSPREVASLMGYHNHFQWPRDFSSRKRYQLLGNALAVPVTRTLLSQTQAMMIKR
ncbi:MAG: DNA cytosine methyltransferase [Rubripirellula sp.]|nr:DNA cytosine methyltransferase [Rubripirellula sp.]